ncbi:MAG: hypothetical protein PHG65_04920, partial [Kiritimatiellae bacterium]|nr:hypothetical protein [Kiritimatiellia bacterium]
MNLLSLHTLAPLLKLCFSGNPLVLLTASGLLLLASGMPACLFSRTSNTGQRITVLLMGTGSAIGLTGWFRAVSAAKPFFWMHPWSLPWGTFSIGVDALSAVFLLPILLIPALGSFYALGYHPQSG